MKFKKYHDDVLFLPLGGSAEIGMNVNLYHYQGKWLMVDLGAGFADEDVPGVDMIAPDLSFIIEHKKDLVGLLLTHAHEDHLGAVNYLWGQLGCPIYTTPFTAAIVKAKLAGDGIPAAGQLIEIPCNSDVKIGNFNIELVQITHSIPEMNAALITVGDTRIFHTGDWKLDPKPVEGPATDEKRLADIGKKGVDILVGDSTNVFSKGHSGSEGELRANLAQIFKKQKGLIAVTTFASNVARVHSIAMAAQDAGRQVGIQGRSLHRVTEAAKSCGYLQDIPEFVPERQFNKVPRDELVIICTGCQGEPHAAMNKIITDNNQNIRLKPGDTAIFSSKIIPGNEKKIFHMVDKLVRKGVEIITEIQERVHVSGHPNRDELQRMYELTKPKCIIPVHGTPAHIHEHVKFAKTLGIKEQVEITNGQVVKISGEVKSLGHVQSGYLAVDGYLLQPIDGEVIDMRRRMQRDGIIVISLVLEKKGLGLRAKPDIILPGVIDEMENKGFIKNLREEIQDALENCRQTHDEKIATHVRKAIRRIIQGEVGKFPAIKVLIARV